MSNVKALKDVPTLMQESWDLLQSKLMVMISILLVPIIAGLILQFIGVGSFKILGMLAVVVMPLLVLAAIVLSFWPVVALILVLNDKENSLTVTTAYQAAIPKLLSFAIVGVMVAIVVSVGLIFFIIPGIIFLIWFMFAAHVNVLEGKSGIVALKQSRNYISGYWWAATGRLLGLLVVVLLISTLATYVFTGIGIRPGSGAVKLLGGVVELFISAFSASYIYVLYKDFSKNNK